MNTPNLAYPVEELLNFKASNKWVGDFIKRHGAVSKILHVEAKTRIGMEREERDISVIRAILESYDSDHIFNVDETSLFYRCLPRRSYIFPWEGSLKESRGSKVFMHHQ